jgi:hypothetical protein
MIKKVFATFALLASALLVPGAIAANAASAGTSHVSATAQSAYDHGGYGGGYGGGWGDGWGGGYGGWGDYGGGWY